MARAGAGTQVSGESDRYIRFTIDESELGIRDLAEVLDSIQYLATSVLVDQMVTGWGHFGPRGSGNAVDERVDVDVGFRRFGNYFTVASVSMNSPLQLTLDVINTYIITAAGASGLVIAMQKIVLNSQKIRMNRLEHEEKIAESLENATLKQLRLDGLRLHISRDEKRAAKRVVENAHRLKIESTDHPGTF